ncbi:PP2C family protein-serine/threonine phosphatase [uncultured Streptomyces sp.]|uniref:PP2C family protein-serine/threonine phosphatase n=1 Tax=uncultured Streptomyces sp. TaxID=174707 RepID=UPI002606ED9F|nr:PP2C family protein-serine/threonine phosphatase [uncultured Streptomyces sp.]
MVCLLTGVALDTFGPQPYTGLPLLAAAPLVAGATLPRRSTAAVAVAACAATASVDVLHARGAVALSVDLALVGLIGMMALAVNRIIARRVRELAEAVQLAVLPEPPRRIGPLAVAAGYTAAQAETRIGGDLYAVQETPHGIRMVIGDVRGKGLQAIAAVSVAIGAFRQEAQYAPSLGELARRLDDALAREAARTDRGTSEQFTTALLVELSHDGETLTLLNRGHPAPYLVHDGGWARLDATSPRLPLGMGLGAPQDAGEAAPVDTATLPHGASLMLITDGVTEARNRHGVFYDPIRSRLRGRRFTDPQELVDALTADVSHWTGDGHQDDMAILVVTRRHPDGSQD